MSNYPDDIRSYDDDPRSPFYKGDTVQIVCKEDYCGAESEVHENCDFCPECGSSDIELLENK